MATIVLAARALVSLVFAVAAASKLSDPAAVRSSFREFGVGQLERFAGFLAPAELLIAVSLLLASIARLAAFAAALLLLAFMAGIANALRLGRRPDCGCFGAFRPTPIGRSTIGRNAVLVLLAGLIVVSGPGPAIDEWLRGHDATTAALVAVLTLAAAAAVMYVGLTGTTRVGGTSEPSARIHRHIQGAEAPDFSLSDMRGEQRTLASLRASGLPIVLLFGNSGCDSCLRLFGDLARWQLTLAERLELILVGGGDLEQMTHLCEQFGIRQALLDPDGRVSQLYGLHGTPSAFALTPAGEIASGPARGKEAIEDLIRLTIHRDEPILGKWKRMTEAA